MYYVELQIKGRRQWVPCACFPHCVSGTRSREKGYGSTRCLFFLQKMGLSRPYSWDTGPPVHMHDKKKKKKLIERRNEQIHEKTSFLSV